MLLLQLFVRHIAVVQNAGNAALVGNGLIQVLHIGFLLIDNIQILSGYAHLIQHCKLCVEKIHFFLGQGIHQKLFGRRHILQGRLGLRGFRLRGRLSGLRNRRLGGRRLHRLGGLLVVEGKAVIGAGFGFGAAAGAEHGKAQTQAEQQSKQFFHHFSSFISMESGLAA